MSSRKNATKSSIESRSKISKDAEGFEPLEISNLPSSDSQFSTEGFVSSVSKSSRKGVSK